MFKSIGKAISSAYSSVKSGISSALSAITGKTNTANASTAPVFGSSEYMRQTASQGSGYQYGQKVPMGASGSWTTNLTAGQLSPGLNSGLASSGGSSASNQVYGPQLPVTISAGQQKVFSGGGSTPQLSLGSGGFLTSPVTISAKTLGAQTSGASGASLQSTGTSISNPVTLSSNPTSVNPTIDNTRLAGALSGFKQYNPKTGTFDDLATESTKDKSTLADKVKAEMDILNKYMPEKQSVFDDPQVIEARNKRQQLQQALQVPTAELNAIIAKQNQDLLQLRQTGSQEGVTEAVYGGQQNAINYNAAIRALPLQASISAIQGDLKLAQDYLTELTQVKQEQINRQYEYNKAQFDAIKGIITKEDQRAYDEIKTQNDRTYKEQQDLIKVQSELLINALSNKAPQTVINRINNATSIQDAVVAAGSYAKTADNQVVKLDDGTTVVVDKNTGAVVKDLGGSSGAGTGYSSKQLTTLTKLNQDVSKNATYSKTTSMRNYGDNVVASLSQRTGVGDIAAINQFQKVIDEGAVTRDQDVRLIQQSQSLLNTLKTKIKKLEKGEQLSPDLRTQMQTAVEKMYEKQVEALLKDPYITAKKKEAELNGLTLSDTILGDLQSFAKTTNTINVSGKDYVVGQVYQDSSGTKWVVDSNGKWTPQ